MSPVNKSVSFSLKATAPLSIIYFRRKKVDTRLLRHAHDISLNYQDFIIHTPDTDAFILVITMWVIEARIFINTGKQNNLKLIDVENMANGVDCEIKLAYARHS